VPLLGWLGSIFIGTSTVANLLLSRVVDPIAYPALACGSALGVQLAFQSLTAMRSILNDQVTEKEILSFIAPIAFAFVLVLLLFVNIYGYFK
jgi:L-lactate permease